MEDSEALRKNLVNLLSKRQAHAMIDDAVGGFPKERMNEKPLEIDYSFWHLLEHIRLTQEDILQFIKDKDYEEKSWPDDYWPKRDGDEKDWNATIKQIIADRDELIKIAKTDDLFREIEWGDGQTVLREILVAADHMAYHLGAFILMRKLLGIWK